MEEYWTIEPHYTNGEPDGVVVYHHGIYPESSVLAGEPFRQWVEHFDNVYQAATAFPNAEVLQWSTKEPAPIISHVAPDWFHEEDAGERWDDDY